MTGDADGPGRREVVVPLAIYKIVTVFSTLIAVVSVVFGFVLIDAATLQMSVVRRLVTAALTAVGVPVDESALSAALAIVGLAVVAGGAGVYTLGTRFQARGMGKSQEDSDEGPTNG